VTAPPDVTIYLKRLCEGGVTRVGCILASGFAERGLRVEVATPRPDGPARALLSDRVTVTPLRSRMSGPVATAIALARHLRRARPGVLLSPGNHTHATTAAAHALAGARGVRLVLKITNPVIKSGARAWKRFYKRPLYRWFFARAAAVLVLSPGRVDELARLFPGAASKLRFVHNPYVTAPMRDRGNALVENASGEPMILSVGRLSEQKNPAMLLRAASRIRDTPWRLVFLGSGPLEGEARALAGALGIADRVRFEGFVADPVPFFRSARVLALSSRWEDLPAVVLEALACGCPVVATACSDAMTAVLEEAGHGAVVPIGDETAMADALSAILRDPPARCIPPAASAYRVENGVAEHLDAIRPLLAAR
jgi:glycosyltransferase involved in cell wall biosynthesis